jgi:transcriptional/translational regulatory protein YebC/TACO1
MAAPGDLESVRQHLEEAGVAIESAEIAMQPKTTIEVEASQARQNLRLIEMLEDHDDVQRVTANFDLPAEVLAEAASA